MDSSSRSDVLILMLLVLATIALLLVGPTSIFLFTAIAVAFVFHVAGMIPQLEYDGLGTIPLIVFVVVTGLMIVF